MLVAGWLSRGWLSVAIADSLVCDESVAQSDAILVENFDPAYLVFEEAARLRRSGIAQRVLVPVAGNEDASEANAAALGITNVLANLARVGTIETVPMREVEPISLNAARDVLQYMQRENIHSVVVVSPLFRSRRSALVYEATLGAAGITVRCSPVRENRDTTTWTRSWHGMQNVAQQWLKLQYYRLYVLPLKDRKPQR